MENLIKIYKKYQQAILYLVFGVLTTVVNIVVFQLCFKSWGQSSIVSNIIAWVFAVLFAYLTNRKLVFNSPNSNFKAIISEIFKFFIARASTLVIDLIIVYIGVDILGYDSLIVKLISNVVVVVSNYVLSKLVIFK